MKKIFLSFLIFTLKLNLLLSQGTILLTLNDALKLAEEQSLQNFLNKHYYLADYWAYKSYKADYLPSLSFNSNPVTFLNVSQLRYNSISNLDEFVRTKNLGSYLGLDLSQKISATGGTFSAQSDLNRIQNFGNNNNNNNNFSQYSSQPIKIQYRQELFGFNEMKWQKKIEPIKYEKAKKEYLESTESLYLTTTSLFFNLLKIIAQKEISETNIENSTNLLKIAEKRFELGAISREELLDMRLSVNNLKIELEEVNLYFRERKEQFLNYLMLPIDTDIEIVVPNKLILNEVNIQLVLEKAIENNPKIMQIEQTLLENERNVEQANKGRHFRADLDLSYGISRDDGNPKNSGNLYNVYTPDFEDYQKISVGINIPILDWGRNKGRYQMAKSQQKIAQTSTQQTLQQFKQSAITQAITFNIQKSKVESAAISDTLANESYHLTMERFKTGQSDVLRLTSSQKAKDNAQLQYINALSDYWYYYFTIRKLTLFNFENNEDIMFDEDKLIK